MAQVNDCKFLTLRDLGYGGSIDDMEIEWGNDNGLPDGASGILWYEALINAGITPAHINDMESSFWCDGAGGPVLDADLFFPLTANLTGTVDGVTVAATFARAAGPSSVDDFEGIVHKCTDNEARFQGARRVENLHGTSEDFTTVHWQAAEGAVKVGEQLIDGMNVMEISFENGTDNSRLQDSSTFATIGLGNYQGRYYVRAVSGTTSIRLILASIPNIDVVLTEEWQWVNGNQLNAAAGFHSFGLRNNSTFDSANVYIARAQYSAIPATDTPPEEYISVGIGDDHGSNVDGVKYFTTDRAGADLATLKGIMVEDTRTNIQIESTAIGTGSWIDNGEVLYAFSDDVAPDGGTNATKVIGSSVSSSKWVALEIAIVDAEAYVQSVYAKAGELQWLQIVSSTGFASGPFANFDLVNGVLGASSGAGHRSIVDVGNGWYRCSFGALANFTQSGRLLIVPMNADLLRLGAWTGNDVDGLYLWGAQVENNNEPSTFIPTTTVVETRSDESLFAPVPVLLQAILSGMRMRCVWQRPNAATTGADQYIMDAIGGVAGEQITMTHAESTQNALAFAFSGGSPSATELDVNLSIPAVNRMYVEYNTISGLTLSLNGTTANTAMPVPPDLTGGTLMGIGCRASDGGNTINGSIKNVAVIDTSVDTTSELVFAGDTRIDTGLAIILDMGNVGRITAEFERTGATGDQHLFDVNSGNLTYLRLRQGLSFRSSVGGTGANGGVYALDTRYQVEWKWDGLGSSDILLDGVSQGPFVVGTSLNGGFNIGASGSLANALVGVIKNVNIYDLNDVLLHSWAINEGSGTTITDSVGGVDGTLILGSGSWQQVPV